MPIETTSVSARPVAPRCAPERTRSLKARIASSVACTSAFTSRPSTTSAGAAAAAEAAARGARSAACSTARPSVGFSAFEPLRMAASLPGRSAFAASASSSGSVAAVARWREKSSTMPSYCATMAAERAASCSRSRRCGASGALGQRRAEQERSGGAR